MDAIRREMPSKSFSEMIAVLRKFVSFMNITVSLHVRVQMKNLTIPCLPFITCMYVSTKCIMTAAHSVTNIDDKVLSAFIFLLAATTHFNCHWQHVTSWYGSAFISWGKLPSSSLGTSKYELVDAVRVLLKYPQYKSKI